jgi:lipopolysaccharide biosynthesis protein
MKEHFNIVVFCHLFYEESWREIRDSLNPLSEYSHRVFINICSDMPYCDSLEKQIREERPEFEIIKSPNKGRDIGGKLKCVENYMDNEYSSDYMIFLHDKVSPSRPFFGRIWRSSLFRILRRKYISHILNVFKNDKVGMVGSRSLIDTHLATNYESICTLCSWYKLPKFEKKDIKFIAGAMFWVRSAVYEEFFNENSPLEAWEELEDGNTDDIDEASFTHSWERLFSLIVLAEGQDIIGV